MNLKKIKSKLRNARVTFDIGLSDVEIEDIEKKFGFKFPPDLREFLSFSLPTSDGWINWRDDNDDSIQERLNWPFEGICFDIENNEFWLDAWGNRPGALDECYRIARNAIDRAPILIPIYSHRYIPDKPCATGNPVFSVYQTDIILFGSNLENYFRNEFHRGFGRDGYQYDGSARNIDFWSELVG